jgi:hypothetical protein
MTFLNPLMLFGLLAATIPVLLHLFNLRKLERIEFSSLAFLKELQKTKIRRLKLRQLLLLVLRTLLVILLVTAFSRPTIRSSSIGATGAQTRTTAVFVFDDSYSMTSSEESGQLLKQAKESATSALDLLKDGDEAFLVKLSEVNPSGPSESTLPQRDLNQMRREIQSIGPSYVHRTIEDALRFSAALLARTKNYNKEIYVFSDFKLGSLQSKFKPANADPALPPELQFLFLSLGNKARQNLGIESLKIQNALFGPGRPIDLNVKIANWGSQDARNELVSVFLNGARVAQKAVDIQAQNSSQVEIHVTPTVSGYIDGMVELQDDDLDFDNHRSFTVYIPKNLNVLMVGNPADLRFIRMALTANAGDAKSTIRLNEIASDRLSANEISLADVIIFSNVKDLTSPQFSQMRTFLESGGGLIFFPGTRTDSASFSASWRAQLKMPRITSTMTPRLPSAQTPAIVTFDRIDYRNPIFEGMFLEDPLKKDQRPTNQRSPSFRMDSPDIRSYVRYQVDPLSVPIIFLTDGFPFLLEQKVGKGVVLLYSVSSTNDWSNLPLKGIFAPLLHRSVAYVAQQQSLPLEAIAGDEAAISIKAKSIGKLMVQNPERVDFAVSSAKTGTTTAVRFRETAVPGIYTVRSDNDLLKKFVVKADPDESNTTKADNAVVEGMLKRLGIPASKVHSANRDADIRQAILESRVGVEIWKFLVGIALLVAVAELLVSRTRKTESSS